MALNTDKLKRPNQPGTQPQQSEQPRDGVRSEMTAGLANTVTAQIQQTVNQIQIAEDFADRAAVAVADRAHSLLSGDRFSQTLLQELNERCAAQPWTGFDAVDMSEAEALLQDLGKRSLPPSPSKQRFLPSN